MGLDILGKHVPRKMLTENNGVRTLRNVQIGKTCDEQMPLWAILLPLRSGTKLVNLRIACRDSIWACRAHDAAEGLTAIRLRETRYEIVF